MRPAYISRRQLLRTSSATLLAMNLWPGTLAHADAPAADFEFIAANDTHFRDANCPKFFERVAAKIKEAAPKSELCLVLGDLANRNRVAQLAGMRDVLKAWKIQTRVVRGNHDWTATTPTPPVAGHLRAFSPTRSTIPSTIAAGSSWGWTARNDRSRMT